MDTKLVLVLREGLTAGVAANAAAVLSLSLGGRVAQWLGPDGRDADGHIHPGVNTHPVPVLVASSEDISELRTRAGEQADLTVVPFSEVARSSREYDEYLSRLAATPAEEMDYVGLVIFGPKGPVTKLTKRLALLP